MNNSGSRGRGNDDEKGSSKKTGRKTRTKKKQPRRKLGSSRSNSKRRSLRPPHYSDNGGDSEDIIIEPPKIPDPTEKEKNIYDMLSASFTLGDDAARAIARFERDIVFPRYRANDESEEEFRKEEMETICYHLGRLHMIKTILPLYGLEAYETEVLHHFIEKAFGEEGGGTRRSFINSSNSRPPTMESKLFRGDDEAYLSHLAMTTGND